VNDKNITIYMEKIAIIGLLCICGSLKKTNKLIFFSFFFAYLRPFIYYKKTAGKSP